jgi:hypothetical protein
LAWWLAKKSASVQWFATEFGGKFKPFFTHFWQICLKGGGL